VLTREAAAYLVASNPQPNPALCRAVAKLNINKELRANA
jgi:hypothetical protein